MNTTRPLAKRVAKAEAPEMAFELSVSEGQTREEIAQMACGAATVARHWSFARNWLAEAFGGAPEL